MNFPSIKKIHRKTSKVKLLWWLMFVLLSTWTAKWVSERKTGCIDNDWSVIIKFFVHSPAVLYPFSVISKMKPSDSFPLPAESNDWFTQGEFHSPVTLHSYMARIRRAGDTAHSWLLGNKTKTDRVVESSQVLLLIILQNRWIFTFNCPCTGN